MNNSNKKHNNDDKIALFKSCFSGLTNIYGTYDPSTARTWQMKKSVTNDTILAHLKGTRPYGVYLLDEDRTRAIAVDFDDTNPFPPIEFINTAAHYQLPAYLEISKSKGFHVWIFFNNKGVKAYKARLVVKNILNEIEQPQTEIFPKQDFLDTQVSFGNFINTPLFGRFVPIGKTVFIDPHTLKPHPDQWKFLESIKHVKEQVLDEIIELNDLCTTQIKPTKTPPNSANGKINRFGLPPCAQRMLQEGVTQYQRVSCFRLAVHLKRLGLPYDVTVAGLKTWASKNRPQNDKQIIADQEIIDQISYAYRKNYHGFGCNSEAVAAFCQQDCSINKMRITQNKTSANTAKINEPHKK